jgi:hypothetical protein
VTGPLDPEVGTYGGEGSVVHSSRLKTVRVFIRGGSVAGVRVHDNTEEAPSHNYVYKKTKSQIPGTTAPTGTSRR